MKNLKLYTSNRLETLAGNLADIIAANPLPSPFAAETIVVQSRGMERWVSMELATRHGICANCSFPFPNTLARLAFSEFIEDLPDETAFAPEYMTWKIMKSLPELIDEPGFQNLKSYLADDASGLKMYQLAFQIANMFDQYLVYRPQMVLGWTKGKVKHWQAVLWRAIAGEHIITHRAAVREQFIERTKDLSHRIVKLPERISVFGISSLPPFHIGILEALADHIEVNLFFMNPCREYWSDIVSDRESLRLSKKQRPVGMEDLHLERGNALLASLGAQGRDFFSLINQLEAETVENYEDIDGNDMLSVIQGDILNLHDPGLAANSKYFINSDDNSVQIHSCHSPMREIEILHDNLLAMFEADRQLMPKDVLVMTSDIESYAPYIQAVFDSVSDDSQKIPFSIADRGLSSDNPVIDLFLSILELSGSRFYASKVLSILESEHVYRALGFRRAEIELISHWLKKVKIRWGINADHRRKLGFLSAAENTWQAGLERLLLGYALPGGDKRLFKDILPYDEIEGEVSLTLGGFAEFIDKLFGLAEKLLQPRPLSRWAESLAKICDGFIANNDETYDQLQLIRRTLNKLKEYQNSTGFDKDVTLDVIKSVLKREFEAESPGFGFIAGAVTFCAMLPMRSIPFKVICMIGLNDGSFPRQSKTLSFDFISKNFRAGDRSRRNDDRYLFLEAILSARKYLYLSYAGQSVKDNSPLQPSVMVSELLDYIEKRFEGDSVNILDQVVTKHRLQAFNPIYFSGHRKFYSYNEENYRTAMIMAGERQQITPFIADSLPEPETDFKTIDIKRLGDFFANPSKFLLNSRPGIVFDTDEDIIEDHESYGISGLDKYEFESRLLDEKLQGKDIHSQYEIARAAGILPPGMAGKSAFKAMVDDVSSLVENISRHVKIESLQDRDIDVTIADFRITGRIAGIHDGGLVMFRPAKIKAKDLLRGWLNHLLFNYTDSAAGSPKSLYVGLDRAFEYKPIADCRALLEELLKIYWAGLHKPLSFFPQSSFGFAEAIYGGKPEGEAIKSAENAWRGSERSRGEGEDLYFQICFKHKNIFDDEFMNIARAIFEPIFDHKTDLKF